MPNNRFATNHRFARLFAAPVLSIGIAGAALGLATIAHADSYSPNVSTSTPGLVATPTIYADPAPEVESWGQWLSDQEIEVPQVDTTVHQSR